MKKRPTIIAVSEPMIELINNLKRAASGNATVLLTGETGTGKSLLARYVHEKSPRRNYSFVGINTAEFPQHLIETELFGHVKGSFTGASKSRSGLVQSADGGTFFFDEIGDAPKTVQSKLLTVLEKQSIRRVGSNQSEPIDVRFVFATHRDLTIDVEEGHFRADLHYRIQVIALTIPPLRERRADIEPLARMFLKRFSRKHTFAPETLAAFRVYSWPGNIRQLSNAIERAVYLSPTKELTPDGMPLTGIPAEPAKTFGPLKPHLEKCADDYIQSTLDHYHGDQVAACKTLGITRTTPNAKDR